MAQKRIPRRWLQWASGLTLMAVGCAEPAATAPATAPLIPSGEARVWFYRPWEPSESFNLARIDMNDSYAVKVVSLKSWGASVSSCKNCARDAFYAWLIPPEVAQVEIARDRNGI
jgi:hypothetical protein